ncbi:Hypothetical protein RG540_CH06240 [Neorhizobium galegae bv. orientalis str. HAMBI 540]|uniref:Uncharacterized protein n=2 Tax=Neorhizobium galegae TaxID=399 RepID=A0A068SLV9_NEOGA|nr:Hypothetical protein RG540_CH06240 [Neorhizobium galegae bv. orientalis str. HAMBI 540]
MPYRLRDLLPAFEIETGNRKDTKLTRQVAGLAEFLHKQERTIRSYISYSSAERMMPAEDYWATAVEWVKRRARASVRVHGKPDFFVRDHNHHQIYETVWMWQAVFLGDVDQQAEGWKAYVRGQSRVREYDEAMQRRSRLRHIVRNDILSLETICDVMEFDLYCLTDYQMEGVDWRSTPSETKLQTLERMQAEMIGEAA